MATISKENKVLTIINVFTVRPEDQDRLADLLARITEETMCRRPGFISANLHKSADGVRVANYAQWASREAWEAMFADPEVKKHLALTAGLGTPDYHFYEVSSTHEAR